MDIPMDVSNTVITTDRLVLRPLTMDDLADYYAYASEPGVGEMAGWKHHETMKESEAKLRRAIRRRQTFAITRKEDGKLIGTFGFRPSWANDEEAYANYKVKEIGFSIAKPFWGQGLVPEAVNALVAYGFYELKLDAVTCCHFADNLQSRRVIEKCGFRFVRQSTHTAVQLQKTLPDRKYILLKKPS